MSKDGTLLTHVPELCMADEEEGTSHSCATSCPQRTSGRVCRHHWAKGWIGLEGRGRGRGLQLCSYTGQLDGLFCLVSHIFGTLACAPVAVPFVAVTCGLVSCMVCCENM